MAASEAPRRPQIDQAPLCFYLGGCVEGVERLFVGERRSRKQGAMLQVEQRLQERRKSRTRSDANLAAAADAARMALAAEGHDVDDGMDASNSVVSQSVEGSPVFDSQCESLSTRSPGDSTTEPDFLPRLLPNLSVIMQGSKQGTQLGSIPTVVPAKAVVVTSGAAAKLQPAPGQLPVASLLRRLCTAESGMGEEQPQPRRLVKKELSRWKSGDSTSSRTSTAYLGRGGSQQSMCSSMQMSSSHSKESKESKEEEREREQEEDRSREPTPRGPASCMGGGRRPSKGSSSSKSSSSLAPVAADASPESSAPPGGWASTSSGKMSYLRRGSSSMLQDVKSGATKPLKTISSAAKKPMQKVSWGFGKIEGAVLRLEAKMDDLGI